MALSFGLGLPPAPKKGVGGWTPARLGASLLGWWDAERVASIAQSGGLVSSWTDIVGSYAAAQAGGAAKPAYSATSFNGRPGITFDGVDDELTLSPVPAAWPTAAAGGEIWALLDQTTPAAISGDRRIVAYGNDNLTSRSIYRSIDTGVCRATMLAGDGAVGLTVIHPTSNFTGRHVVRGAVAAGTESVDVDGIAGNTRSATPATATLRARFGATAAAAPGAFLGMVVSQILVTGPLTAPQAADLTTYLKARGGIS